MKVEEAIRNRRSIRRYKRETPKHSDIEKILQAGIWAPSGLNNQPWKFKILKNGDGKNSIARFTKYGDVIRAAPVVICVFLDKKASYDRDKDILAIGACIQNIILTAYEPGLASCWLGEILKRKRELRKHLGISPNYELMAVVALGYPDETEISERKELDEFLL